MDISCNKKGTWTLQTIIAAVTQEEEFELIKQNLIENDNILGSAFRNLADNLAASAGEGPIRCGQGSVDATHRSLRARWADGHTPLST